ncbi:YdiK family protein [Salimicrobium sp. PL1-032A]|uniref:YdiK family protein n=1 Tax=Salimicrobium sp. PL1-032A TaxID=3095364 RepID=UPI0032619514
MKASPLVMAYLYLLIGAGFLFVAVQSIEGSIWNATTMILALISTFNVGVGIRLIGLHFKIKNKNNSDKK